MQDKARAAADWFVSSAFAVSLVTTFQIDELGLSRSHLAVSAPEVAA